MRRATWLLVAALLAVAGCNAETPSDSGARAGVPATDDDQSQRAYDVARAQLVKSGAVSPRAQFPPYEKRAVNWTGPGLYEVEATVWDAGMTEPRGWAANVQWDAERGWRADAALLKVATKPTPFGDAQSSQTAPQTNAIGETPDQERARLATERETRRQTDIDYHQGKIDDLRAERSRLVSSLETNASPDIVLQEIADVDRQIAHEKDSIIAIQNQR